MCRDSNVEENIYRQNQRLIGGEAVHSLKPRHLSLVSVAETTARHSHGCLTWSDTQSVCEL